MASVFALVSAAPGRERELLDALAHVPGVQERQHLFGELIAVRLDEEHLSEARGLAAMHGVREARLYHGHEAWTLRPRRAGS